MSTTSLLLLGVCFISLATHAQNDSQAISQWQSGHPSTLLISADRYNTLSDNEQLLLGEDFIVYHDEITLAQLEQSARAKSNYTNSRQTEIDLHDDNASAVKQWLGEHPDVMIVRKSEYTAMDEAKQLECRTNSMILLLKGEQITAQDIYYYEN